MSEPWLRLVDGTKLPGERRGLLQPGETRIDQHGRVQALPHFFYEVESWAQAKALQLTAHFTLAELMTVDCREAPLLLDEFPHYVPSAVTILARYLEAFRLKVDAPVYIAANGGYRSPAHALAGDGANPHLWATAADIYRIGDTFLDDREAIEKYGRIAQALAPEWHVRAFQPGDDHLHVDLGYVVHVPRATETSS